jgi:hypothetical protein
VFVEPQAVEASVPAARELATIRQHPVVGHVEDPDVVHARVGDEQPALVGGERVAMRRRPSA